MRECAIDPANERWRTGAEGPASPERDTGYACAHVCLQPFGQNLLASDFMVAYARDVRYSFSP
jgi:hypothetical protein